MVEGLSGRRAESSGEHTRELNKAVLRIRLAELEFNPSRPKSRPATAAVCHQGLRSSEQCPSPNHLQLLVDPADRYRLTFRLH
jgi:hypothetical protein